MKREFITVRGKLIIDNERIVIRNLQSKNNSDIYWIGFNLLLCLNVIGRDSKAKPLAYMGLGILGLLFLIWLYEIFFLNSWRNKFSMNEIRSYKVDADHFGLETTVTLKLYSGRQKEIVFRTNEKQHEEFIELVSNYTVQTQFA